jgi:Zn-finger nucleic acid-binding protein
MECPVCKVTLQMSERQGVEIDYCPKCRGVWLDRGELDKLIELSAGTHAFEASPSAPYSSGDYDDPRSGRWEESRDRPRHAGEDYYRPRKKESWLGRLLDFD